jgi:hypothetical protein
MKTAVSGEDAQGHIVYNRALVDFARHHGFHPKGTARRRAGCEVRAWPRSPQGRSSFAAPVGARFPRRIHASVSRL